MTFTVAVERISPDEQFTAGDIELFHQECGGGEITRSDGSSWQLYCRRCHMEAFVFVSNDGTALLMKTAIDGESRQIKKSSGDDIYAIPRT